MYVFLFVAVIVVYLVVSMMSFLCCLLVGGSYFHIRLYLKTNQHRKLSDGY